MDPAKLANGATATRTVSITATGVTAEALPPPPKMRARWLISFIAPEERSTELTPKGPISTVTWRWRMRPVSSEPGRLKAFHIPWFDTRSRQMRDVVLSSQRIAFAAIEEEGAGAALGRLARYGTPIAMGAGLLLTLGALAPGLRLLNRHQIAARLGRFLPDRAAMALRSAARRGDAKAFRHAAVSLVARLPAPSRAAERDRLLAELDRKLYGPAGMDAPLAPADLRRLGRAILTATRGAQRGSRNEGSCGL